jgi:hypothetical protein
MKLLNFQGISMPTFYKYATILLGISLIGSGISAKIQWVALNIGGKISIVGNFLFQALLLVLFFGLWMQIKKQERITEIGKIEMEKFMSDIKNEIKDDKKVSIPKYTLSIPLEEREVELKKQIKEEREKLIKYLENKMKGGVKNGKENIIKN